MKIAAFNGQYTFFDYRTANALKRNMGWRVDHIPATPSFYRKVFGQLH